MIALPVDFLPFDPNRDNKDSDDEEEEESSPESEEEESSEDNLHPSISNGENHHRNKSARHIGGGVVLVSRSIF